MHPSIKTERNKACTSYKKLTRTSGETLVGLVLLISEYIQTRGSECLHCFTQVN